MAITDEEVKAALFSNNPTTEQQKPAMSDEDVRNYLLSNQSSSNQQKSVEIPQEEESGVSIPTRAWLSFHNKNDQMKILKKDFSIVEPQPDGNFLVGNDPRDLQPVTPDGLFNDLVGKLADHAADIPVIAGQLGALAIAPEVAIPAKMAMSGLGAGAGQAVSSAIGEKKLGEMATDVAASAAFGAAAEGLVQGAITGSKVLAPKLSSMLDKLNIKSSQESGIAPEETKFAKATTKIFKYLANVPEASTQTFFKYGMKEMNNPVWFKPDTVVGLVDDTVKALKQTNAKLGQEVGRQTAELRGLGRGESIPVDDLFETLRENARSLGILDEAYKVNKLYPNTADIKPMTNMLRELGDVNNGSYVASPGKKISVDKALEMSKSFGQKFESVSKDVQNSFHTVLNGDEALQLQGIRPRITAVAEELGLKDYAAVNKKYSDLLKLQDRLGSVDIKNPGKIESLINRLESTGLIVKRDLASLDNMVGGDHLKKWSLFNAAQDFNKSDLNILRFGAIAGILGGITGFNTNQSKAGTIIGAGLLGTPAGLKMMVRTANRAGMAISKEKLRQMGTATGSRIDKKTSSAILAQLIKSKSESSNNKNNGKDDNKNSRKF